MAKTSTVFQTLDKAIRGNWNTADMGTMPHVNHYNMSGAGKDILYKTTNKDDYEAKKLELQQNNYLKDRWVKANVNMSVTAYAGLNNVKLMYRDADLMDASPEIGAALDIMSEESTLADSSNNVVHVYSKSDRIKNILEDLFCNRLNLQSTAQMVIRAMCKYGNQFMLLDIDHKNGVKGWKQLPVFNVERVECGIQNPYGAGVTSVVNSTNAKDADLSTQFVWLDDNNSQIPFRDWQVAHFRLLNNSLYLPYGMSALSPARRSWRMLSLMEDMMLIYRLERSMERRVYKIYVGAIDDADVGAYVEQVANEFKRTPIIDPMTGQVDLRKNILPVHKDTPIPLLDGRTITIKQLAEEYNNGRENYVYSVQDNTHQIVPGKVVWCGKNYTAKKLYRITLDDGSHFDLAPEHEIIMRDGSKKRADMVNIGESVMPFYYKDEPLAKSYRAKYEKVYNPNSGLYEFTHRLVGKELVKENGETIIHHRDFNRKNNNPTNLQWMTWNDHKDLHISYNSDPMVRKNHSDNMKEMWQTRSEEETERHIQNMTTKFDEHIWDEIDKAVVNGDIYSQNQIIKFINENLMGYLLDINSSEKLHHYQKITKPTMKARFQDRGFDNVEEYLNYMEDNFNAPSHIEKLLELKKYNANKYNFGKNFHLHPLTSEQEKNRSEKISKNNHERYLNGGYEKVSRSNRIDFSDEIWDELRLKCIEHIINTPKELIDYLNEYCLDRVNDFNHRQTQHISKDSVKKRLKGKGFDTITDFINSIRKNHKISNIEIIEGDDVYCMTVVGLNGEEDRHNFAIRSLKEDNSWNDSGCFVSNCADNDLFIPVRSESSPTPIDTLPAGNNITALDDIKYVQNKVVTALRIPKAFLNFEEAAGDGKNLALMDIRFTRTVNRIQQAFLMELTKIASIHLYLLGFSDELTNFTLSMNNPSTQAEQLEIETIQKKIDAIRDAVSDPGNGLPVMSLTRALKEIMKWSEKEIKENLEEIRLEKGIAAELEKTTQIIKKTGIFDTVDRIYGEPGAKYQDEQQGGDQGGMDGGPGGGPGGGGDMGGGAPPPMDAGGDMGGDLDSLGAPGGDMGGGDIAGQEGSMPTADMSQPMENRYSTKPLLTENDKKIDSVFKKYLESISNHELFKDETITERTKPHDSDSLLINEDFDKMIDSLGKFVIKD